MEKHLTPTLGKERIISLDILRGFSLLGIFIVNIIAFHSPYEYYNPYEWWKYGDYFVYAWIDVLVQASFYPIFAMMFGYGLVIMQERSLDRGVSFGKIGVRRMLALLMFGVIHAFFIWHGDILITYALLGLLLIPLLRLSGKLLILLGIVIYFLPQIFLSTLLFLISLIDSTTLADFTDIVALQQAVDAYSTGTYWEIMQQRVRDWFYGNNPFNFILIIFMVLPLMMIGAGASKLKWLNKAPQQKWRWLIGFIVFLILGLSVKTLPLVLETTFTFQYIQDMIGGPLLAVAYIAFIVFLTSFNPIKKLFKPLASAGRMSITMYLTQSVVGTLIFYNYGLGLYGEVTLSTSTWLALGIFLIQVILAEIWFIYFRQGPIERLWRRFTYGKQKNLKRSGTT